MRFNTQAEIDAFINSIKLAKGDHSEEEKAFCVIEATAYIAGEPHSDHPACVSQVIGEFCRTWNDNLNDEDRQLLKPYAAKVIGTKTTAEDEETRAWMATDWLCRVQTPAWLRLAGLTEEAQALEATARIVDAVTARAAQPTLNRARERAAAARAAVWAAARAAARAAAWAAARAAAGAAARAAARAAAWAAARAAAWDAARAAAWDAAGAAAGDAAGDAARAAAGDKLRPTVVGLQQSALLLLDAMIEVGRVEPQIAA